MTERCNEPKPKVGGPKFVVRMYGFLDEFERALNEDDGYALHSFSGDIQAGDVGIIAVYVRKEPRP